jgi:hypothetical protein
VEFSSKTALQVSGAPKQRDKDFVPMPLSTSGTYEGPVVFAGYGITSETLQWDDYTGIDVTGKAVVVFRHDPEEKTQGVATVHRPDWRYWRHHYSNRLFSARRPSRP